MKRLIACLFAVATVYAFGQYIPKEYADVMPYLGKKGDFKANVLKVNIPRNDLKIRVAGTDLPTPFGFGGWIAMTKGDKGMNVMMGDLVLLQDEVNPVMSALLDNGLEVTALHNHFFWDEPKIYYMHVHGMGTPDELAHKIKPALDLIGHVPGSLQPGGFSTPTDIQGGTIDTKALDGIVGATGEQNGQVYKYTIGRSDITVKEMGATINARMGLNTWAAFYGSDDNAVVAGDVAMLEGEVTSVLKALRAHNLDVVAIHHHMTGSKPMIVFLHYFGKGNAARLARGFKAALEVLGKKTGHADGDALIALAIAAASTEMAPLHRVGAVPLPDSATRSDYQSMDPGTERLYLSHMGARKLFLFDTKTNRIVTNLPDYRTGKFSAPNAHTVSQDQKTHRVYIALKDVGGKPELWVLEPTR